MFDDDAGPAAPRGYQIGQMLDSMSVEEIKHTVQKLRDEIERLEKVLAQKAGHIEAAESLFSKK